MIHTFLEEALGRRQAMPEDAPVITATFPANLSVIEWMSFELMSFASLMPEYKCSDAQREDMRTP
jgi:hypothetical protein